MPCILPHVRDYLPTASQMATQMTPRKAAVPPKMAHCTESGAWWRSVIKAGKDDLTTGAGASGTGAGEGGRAARGKASGATGAGAATLMDAASATMVAAAHRAS